MKNMLPICSAQGTLPKGDKVGQATRISPEGISSRIREWLESHSVRLELVIAEVKERRFSAHSTGYTATSKAPANAPVSAADQKTVDRIVKVFDRVYQVYLELGALGWAPRLYYDPTLAINAYANLGTEVVVNLALAELVQDSDSELAFGIAHELGHIVQQRDNTLYFVGDNEEFDADVWGELVCFVAGYDPYAGAGILAKLSMATGDVGLTQQFEDQSAQDAHKSFVTRIEVIYDALKGICGVNADLQSLCHQYALHPHFPANAVA